MTNPLFIPLMTQHYNNFESGIKRSELRLYGSRWNEKTCKIGRDVTLSKGYGKKSRLKGIITGFESKPSSQCTQGQQLDIAYIYGIGEHDMAEIFIEVQK